MEGYCNPLAERSEITSTKIFIIMICSLALALVVCAFLLHDSIGLSWNDFQRRSSSSSSPRRQTNYDNKTPTIERTVVLLYNKPSNVLTTHHSDDLLPTETNKPNNLMEQPRMTVYSDIESMKGFVGKRSNRDSNATKMNATIKKLNFEKITGIRSKLHAIGRLDADTTGLLLLTNDGGLVHHVTNRNAPTHDGVFGAITKTYEALIMGHHESAIGGDLEKLWHGVDIGSKYGGMTKPVHDLRILDHPNHKSTLVSITISEGKNRQVRRMFHSIRSGVMKLKRTKIGEALTCGTLKAGQWRILSDEEVTTSLNWEPRELLSTTPPKRIKSPRDTRSVKKSDKNSRAGKKKKRRQSR